MKILALDSSTEACSVALLNDDEVISRYEFLPKQHNQLILRMIDELMSEASLHFSQLDCLALSNGPGSYTGLRLSAGVVQGVAFANDLPVVLVSSLAVLAQGAVREYSASKVISALDARMGQLFWGVYALNSQNIMESVVPDVVVNPGDVLIPDSDYRLGVGPGWKAYRDDLQNIVGQRVQRIESEFFPHAEDVLPLAKGKFLQHDVVKSALALPVYLRDVK